jgi:hypothetical protein
MRIFPMLAAAALFSLTAAAFAGRPANGYFYFTFSRDFSGDNIGKVEWNWDGRQHFWLGAPQTFPRVTAIHSLVYTWDDALLIAGKYKNEMYKIRPGENAFETQKNSWNLPEHIFVEPGLKSAWITDNRGYLYHAPLDPYGKAVEVRPTGSEKGVNTISYRDADVAWYTQSTLFDSTHIGELDTKTMATRRRMTIKSFVSESHYDPFTGHVVMCGDKTLSQYDPAANAIVSSRFFGQESQLYSCAVDGEGHMILSSWNGYIYFIDYSGTGKVGDSSNFTDSAMLVDDLFYITPMIGPGSPPRVRRPFYAGTRGEYRDADGDGRIDHAVLEFKAAVYEAPAQVRLAEPAGPAKSLVFDSTRIRKLDFTHFLLDMQDRPLAFGTSVAPGASARILADTALFGDDELPMRDGVGPQVGSAEARPPQSKGQKPELEVTFSEAVQLDLSLKRFPFLIKRPEVEVNGLIQVESIRDLGSHRYRFVFASTEFPLLGDSLKLIPGDSAVPDSVGNLNNMSVWIRVGGDPFPVFSIQPEQRACLASYQVTSPPPLAPAVLVVDPGPGLTGGDCLNCPDNRMAEVLGSSAAWLRQRNFDPWLMTLKIRGPIRYSLHFFSTLGTFVNSEDGMITPDMIRKVRPGRDGLYTVRLYWWPVTRDGRLAATGAYLMRGNLSGDGLENPLQQSSTEALGLPRKSEKISATFGFLRGD